MNYYIAQNGNDKNKGTENEPFLTLEKAKNTAKAGDTVYIMGGRYHFSDTVRFYKENSGVTYRAYNDEPIYFDGGVVINPDDVKKVTDKDVLNRIIEESEKENLYSIDLSKYISGELFPYGEKGFRRPIMPSGNELFINGKAYSAASYPKNKYIKLQKVIDTGSIPRKDDFSMRGGIIGYSSDRMKKWQTADSAYLMGFFSNGFADDTIKIKEINAEEKSISLKGPHLFGMSGDMQETRWKIVNLLEEISQKGEYFIDVNSKTLYFYPDCDIKSALIQVSCLGSPILSFLDASNITFSGITFENSRSTGVYIERGEGITVQNSVFRNLGTVGIQIGMGSNDHNYGTWNETGEGITFADGKDHMEETSEIIGNFANHIYDKAAFDGHSGKNHLISGCEVYNTGAGGMYMGGGNRKNLIPAGNKVYNTHFHNLNRTIKTYAPAVYIWGVGNIISHCEMNDLSGTAVLINGNDHLIEYNRIHDVLKEVSDGGAIYLGRDMSEVGNKIKYNFIYDIKNPHSYDMYGYTAIYLDDGAIYNEVYGNYFYDIVQRGPFFFSLVHWNCGGCTSVANNIAIDCYPGFDPNSYDNSYKRMHEDELAQMRVHTTDINDLSGVDVTSEIWKEHYPYLYKTYTENYNPGTVQYNNFVACGQYQNFKDENPSHLNFNFREDSYMLQKFSSTVTDPVRGIYGETVEFENVPFDKIGLIKD